MFGDNFIKKMKEQDKKNEEFRNSLAYSTDYIDWLEQFTLRFSSFSTDSFLYNDRFLTDEEKENIYHLEHFFEEIYAYAEDNYLPYQENAYGISFPIQHNGVGYSIGIDYGQGCTFYCERLDMPLEDSIEYKYIMSSVKLPNTLFLDSKFDELIQVVEGLIESGVSVDMIEKVLNQKLKELRKVQSEKVKKKI